MHRVTITIDDDLVAEVDRFMAAHGYTNRSEAIRDLAGAAFSSRTLPSRAAATVSRPELRL